MTAAYYNEYDKNAAAWLRELIKRGLIADGEVDERSIIDVQASDLRGFSQCHFFAGIGGWSYALRLARWPDDKPVWTASLPCQPFSTAGKQLGKSDERHLLPHYLNLVGQLRPATQFGEQVEGAIKHGWLDDLQASMEAENYAVGYAVLGAHSVNAPHIRQRLYWVANANNTRLQRRLSGRQDSQREVINRHAGRSSANDDGLGNAELHGHYADTLRRSIEQGQAESGLLESERPNTEWDNPEWIYCRDSKYRPIKPCIKPLVDGVSERMGRGGDTSTETSEIDCENTQEARVMRLRGYGNAIVPQVAAEFIKAFMVVNPKKLSH